MEHSIEQYSDEQERIHEVRTGFDTDGSNIPPEVHRTVQEMRGEYGINPSLEAILHFHPELLEDEQTISELIEVFGTTRDGNESQSVENSTEEQQKSINAVIQELLDSGVNDLTEEEFIEVLAERIGEPIHSLEELLPLYRRYGDHS